LFILIAIGSYNSLNVSGFSHHKINHLGKTVEDKKYTNAEGHFWSQAK
jgi:hypothetical protein